MYDLFSDFFDSFDLFPVYREESKCPKCNMTYSQFKKEGKFGCSDCYEAFAPLIGQTLFKIHNADTHNGKIPSKSGQELKLKKQIDELKSQLKKAVAEEDYEKAAKLHKQIHELEG